MGGLVQGVAGVAVGAWYTTTPLPPHPGRRWSFRGYYTFFLFSVLTRSVCFKPFFAPRFCLSFPRHPSGNGSDSGCVIRFWVFSGGLGARPG